jgi:hypothetical protein
MWLLRLGPFKTRATSRKLEVWPCNSFELVLLKRGNAGMMDGLSQCGFDTAELYLLLTNRTSKLR